MEKVFYGPQLVFEKYPTREAFMEYIPFGKKCVVC